MKALFGLMSVVLLVVAAAPCWGDPVTITLKGTDNCVDAKITSGDYNNWGGASGVMYTKFDGTKKTLIAFPNVATLVPNGADVTSATLQLYLHTSNNQVKVAIHQILVPWVEGTATVSGSPDDGVTWYDPDGPANGDNNWPGDNGMLVGTDYASNYETEKLVTSAQDDKYVDFDLTDLVRRWDNGDATNYGVVLLLDQGYGEYYVFPSEHASTPKLVITYEAGAGDVPEPGTMLLVGTGVLAVLGYMRRRRMG